MLTDIEEIKKYALILLENVSILDAVFYMLKMIEEGGFQYPSAVLDLGINYAGAGDRAGVKRWIEGFH